MPLKLTIGMATYDDFDGVYFSIQALRMYHPEVIDDIEIIVIDNNPASHHGKAIRNLKGQTGIKYIPFHEYQSTAIRNLIFENASAPYVLSMDCHVLFESGSIKKLIEYYEQNPDTKNLLQGPMVYDNLKAISSHFDPVWRAQMYGIWATDNRAKDPNGEPFEILMQGLGVFSARKDNWLGFNSAFRGFGGEEGYIHEKYRKNGAKTLCLPFLRWVHRFQRPNGVKYPLTLENKVRNYFIGCVELGLSVEPIYQHFLKETEVSKSLLDDLHEEATKLAGGKSGYERFIYEI
jgi:hypothetical protein